MPRPEHAFLTAQLPADETRELALRLAREGLDVGDALVASFVAVVRRSVEEDAPVFLARHAARSPGGELAPLGVSWDGAEVFRSLVGRVRDALRTPERAAAGTYSFSFEEALPDEDEDVDVALSVTAAHTPRGLALRARARGTRFERGFVERLLEHVIVLLDAGSRAPDRPAARLGMMGDDERRRIVEEWNDTDEPWPRGRRLHTLFEEVARENPERTAAVFPHGQRAEAVSYAELDGDADRVADLLYRRGVLSDELVGVLAPRSRAHLAALLGVLKAGAAVLPLDPTFPKDRLAATLEDAEVRFVVCAGELAARAPTSAELLSLEGALSAPRPPSPPVTEDDAEQLACALYTSGPTGRPDGVLLPHRALACLIDTFARRPGLSSGDRLLALSPPGLGAALVELLAPLLVGATVVVANDDDARDVTRIAALIADYAVTVAHAPLSRWRALLDEVDESGGGWPGDGGLRALVSGDLPATVAERLGARCGEVWRLFGVPEAGVFSLAHRTSDTPHDPVPAGRPLGNVSAYILDEHKQPVPAGVPGELYLGGYGVARGYQKRPARTRERFLPDPFRKEGGARMVQSGERARWREDGCVELLSPAGRTATRDGHRIELGEVERVLETTPGILQAVVSAEPGDGPLRAWLRGDGAHTPAEELLAMLRARLPEFMLPATFTWLDRFPLRRDGRVDEAQLTPQMMSGGSEPSDSPPSVDLVLEVWRRVLGDPALSATDRFLDAGGDALRAARMTAELAERTGVRLPADVVLRAPDAASLGRVIDGLAPSPRGAASVLVQSGDDRAPVFCLPDAAQDGLSLVGLAAHTDRDRRFLALRWPGLEGHQEPLGDVDDLVEFYVSEIMESTHERLVLAGVGHGGRIAFAVATRLVERGHEVPLLALLSAPGPDLDFVEQKLVRAAHHLDRLRGEDARGRARYLRRWLRGRVSRSEDRRAPSLADLEPRRVDAALRSAVERLAPSQPFPGAGLLVRPLSLPLGLEGRQDPELGWGRWFEGGLEVVEVHASPDELLEEPRVRDVARPLARALAAVDRAKR